MFRMKLRLTTDSTQFSQSEDDDDVSADLDNVAITTMQGLDVESDDNVSNHRLGNEKWFLLLENKNHS
jgi:hypothetical protein